MRARRLAAFAQRHGALLMVMVLLTFGGAQVTGFLTGENLGAMAVRASFLAIVALGLTFVIVSGGIDLSIGAVYSLCGVLAAYSSRWGSAAALAVPVAVGLAFGLVQGWLIGKLRLASFIVTAGGLLFAHGLVLFITAEGQETFTVPKGSTFLELGHGAVPVVVTIVLYLLGGVLLQRTPFGLRLFAIGSSEDASRLMGLPVAGTKIAVYAVSGLLAGLTGALSTAQAGTGVTTIGLGVELAAIAAVVLGGTVLAGGSGAVSGTLAGVVLLGLVHGLLTHTRDLSTSMHALVSGTTLLVVLVVQALLSRARNTD
ncbi:ABC transporter permease [Actinocrispum sp. NPDC049592]|uniref:ABC transporter permease n=1 Tax=Actinocrispum sp. NPDC049592 TaxID=3154835 RepID=UPI003419610A